MTTHDSAAALISAVHELVNADLAPIADAIDRDGIYPRDFLHRLGALGGFASTLGTTAVATTSPADRTGNGHVDTDPTGGRTAPSGLATQISVMRAVAQVCGSTAFLVWCQTACVGYLQKSPNAVVRKQFLNALARGNTLAGTGMSNAVKHLAGIEAIRLKAQRDGDNYRVSGSLPWVSNIDESHLAVVAAQTDDGYIMFVTPCNAPGVSLHPCPEFSALEGTQTLNIRLNDVLITPEQVVAHPDQFDAYIRRIKPAFVLAQIGMGLGIIDASLQTIRQSNAVNPDVNAFLDDQHDDLVAELAKVETGVAHLAADADAGTANMLDILRLRLSTSELTLRAANSAVLHAGARGYLMRHPAQRRLREAVFVAIVTPALKHLRKEIHALEQAKKKEYAA